VAAIIVHGFLFSSYFAAVAAVVVTDSLVAALVTMDADAAMTEAAQSFGSS
jgi:hypothetical protein